MKKYVTITKTSFDRSLRDKVVKLSETTIGIYQKQPGLISAQIRVNPDENSTEHILEWESAESHKASWQNPEFFEWNLVWQELIKTGKVKLELHTYHASPDIKIC